MGKYSCLTEIIALTIYKSPAVTYIRSNYRFLCSISFKYGKRLAFTYTCKNRKIHLANVFAGINSSSEHDIFNLHVIHQRKALLGIIRVLICWSHNPQLQLWLYCLGISKCHNHCLYIFNRGDTKNGSYINILVIRIFLRYIGKSGRVNTIRSNYCL